ncbi:homeobox protein Hox-A4 [Oryza brachyantha]|uniref:homeobox protein Hox-A4 n=1 Tax=Oryza brachyantha TaxID=4533 RepID=UPI001ADD359E|nr:homeobox protein Hox-A4 [Oryza brachyantha]
MISMDQGKKDQAMATSVPEPQPRADAGGDDFEFCVVSSGGLVAAGAADMCVADEVFSQGKLLPLRPSAAAAGDVAGLGLLPRSESVASTVGFGSRSDSRSASSSGSSSGCVSRSQSAKSASSDHSAVLPPPPPPPPRRSLSSSLFYAHPSPSPQLRTRPRRSTGSAPPPATAWGIFRLGVVGAPDVYPPRPAESKNAAAAARVGTSRSARFEPPSAAAAAADRKPAMVGLFGDSFGCKCSPDVVVEPVTLPEAAKRTAKTKVGVKKGRSVRRSRILDWLEELTITKEKKK